MTDEMVGPRAVEPVCDVLKAIGAPVRLAILVALDERPHFVYELVEGLGVSQTLVSQHLRVLRGANLVEARRSRYESTYAAVPHPVVTAVVEAARKSVT